MSQTKAELVNGLSINAAAADSLTINSDGNLLLSDNAKIILGTGGDLEVFHASTNHSWIVNNTGYLYIHADDTDAGVVTLGQNHFIKNEANTEQIITGYANGAVELYFNGDKKLNTVANGIQVRGAEGAAGELYMYADEGDDFPDIWLLKADHVASGFYIQNKNSGSWEDSIRCFGDGAVELFYNNSKKLETHATNGVQFPSGLQSPDSQALRLGDSNDLLLYHDGSHAYMRNTTGDWYFQPKTGENAMVLKPDGAVELYYDDAKHFETTASGTKASGHFLSERAATAMKVNMTSTGDIDAIQMRHARGGLSGYSGKMISFQGNDDTEEGSIVIGTTATAFNTSSDYRLKENQVAISDGITRLKTLKPYRFNFKKDKDTTIDGFFAHEVTPAVPEAITGAKDAMAAETRYEEGDTIPSGKVVGDPKTFSSTKINPQQIDQSKLVPLLTAALQEAITKIETLESKVAALESA